MIKFFHETLGIQKNETQNAQAFQKRLYKNVLSALPNCGRSSTFFSIERIPPPITWATETKNQPPFRDYW
jgi:hypothetical protein